MSRGRRLLLIAVAWAFPLAWFATALLSGPVDGTSLSSTTIGVGPEGWAEPVTVVRAYGDTPLREGDVVAEIEGRTLAEWAGAGAPERAVGDVVEYSVQRRGQGRLDVELSIDVTLTRYPVMAAIGENPASCALALALLTTGSLVFWRRPGATAARAFLAATALLPTALTAAPWGLGPIDLAGARGLWPHAAGEVLGAAGVGTLLLAVLTMTSVRPKTWVAVVAAYAVPLAGYLTWLAFAWAPAASETVRTLTLATVLTPAMFAFLPAVLVAALFTHRRARGREDLLATRLVLLGVGSGVVAWALLEVLPRIVSSGPAVPQPLLALLLLPLLLGSIAVAVSRFRVTEIEPALRRALVQALVVALVGAAFVLLVRALDVASDLAVGSMMVGGLAAMLLLPAAVALQRWVRRLVYGDREFPRRVVSDLRRLDPSAAPEEAVRDTLELLARRLHLSHVAIDLFATEESEAISTSIGQPRGIPVTVDLAVGGATLGSLRLEVDPGHDPFGPGDRRLLEDVGSQVGVLVQAVSMNRELQRSRQHLVTAREEERRRIRRDLHDGLGPSLASLAMQLETAQDLIGEDPHRAADLVGRLSDRARDELAEVRRVVDGLRPAALDQFGLVSALRQRADDHNQGGRTQGGPPGMTWTVDAAEDLEPLPAAVEVAAFRIVVEAVTNAARHSGARTCAVSLVREGPALRIRVRDDGTGLAGDHAPGVGLFSMRERAKELGGTCTITSGTGTTGTTVEAVLPIVADEGQE